MDMLPMVSTIPSGSLSEADWQQTASGIIMNLIESGLGRVVQGVIGGPRTKEADLALIKRVAALAQQCASLTVVPDTAKAELLDLSLALRTDFNPPGAEAADADSLSAQETAMDKFKAMKNDSVGITTEVISMKQFGMAKVLVAEELAQYKFELGRLDTILDAHRSLVDLKDPMRVRTLGRRVARVRGCVWVGLSGIWVARGLRPTSVSSECGISECAPVIRVWVVSGNSVLFKTQQCSGQVRVDLVPMRGLR